MKSAARSSKRPYRQRKTIFELPPLELECMKMLWRLGEGTVRQIREQLAGQRRPLAYTTVETIMDRLTRKGAVERRKQGRAHRYTAVYQKQDARAQAVEAVVEHFFAGSRPALLAHLQGRPLSEPVPAAVRPAAASTSRGSPGPTLSERGMRRTAARARPRSRPQAPEPPLDTTLL